MQSKENGIAAAQSIPPTRKSISRSSSAHPGLDWFPEGDDNMQLGVEDQLSRYPVLNQILSLFGTAMVDEILDSLDPAIKTVRNADAIARRSKSRLALVSLSILTALQRAESFDCLPGGPRRDPSYVELFLQSLELPEALKQLQAFLEMTTQQDHLRGIAVDDERGRTQATLLRMFDDRRREGIPTSDVLRLFAGPIHQAAKAGNIEFFCKLAERIKKPLLKKGGTTEKSKSKGIVLSKEHWIRSLWIPLALWRHPSEAAADLLLAHANLLRDSGREAPESLTQKSLLAALRKFRQRLKRSRRPN